MVGIFAHDGGAFKPAASVPVNNGGTWQNAQEVWAKDNGVWVKVFPALVREPPTGDYYTSDYTTFVYNVSSREHVIFWFGTSVFRQVLPSETTSITVGSWTYYRVSLRSSFENYRSYSIYRIGTP